MTCRSTLDLLMQITQAREEVLHGAILARLIREGRILPGEHLVDIELDIGGFKHRQRFIFPNFSEGRT